MIIKKINYNSSTTTAIFQPKKEKTRITHFIYSLFPIFHTQILNKGSILQSQLIKRHLSASATNISSHSSYTFTLNSSFALFSPPRLFAAFWWGERISCARRRLHRNNVFQLLEDSSHLIVDSLKIFLLSATFDSTLLYWWVNFPGRCYTSDESLRFVKDV